MKDRSKADERLLSEVAALRQRVEELEALGAELHKTKSFYEQLVEGSGDAIIAVDTKGTVVTWNTGAERMLGWKAEEILGRPHARHQTNETKEAIGKYLRQILAGEFLDNLEMPLLKKDGAYVDVLVTGSPVKDASGEIVAGHVIMKDITERKRTEERLRLLTDQVPAVLWTTDAELRFTSSSGAGLVGLNLHPDQVVGMTLFDYFQTDNPDIIPIAAHSRALKGTSENYEFVWEKRTFSCHIEPLRDTEGNVVGTIGIALDITERKEAEALLQETKAFYEVLVGEAGDAIVAIDGEGNILTWNTGAERIFGWTAEEALGGSYLELQTAEASEDIEENMRRAFSGETLINVEMRRRRKDGTWFDGLLTVSPIRDAEGGIIAIQGIIKDISDRKRAEQELLLAEKFAALGRLTSGACHEILNPLNNIIGRFHLLTHDSNTPPEIIHQIKALERQLDRITKVTKGLLLFSRQRPPERVPLDLNEKVMLTFGLLEHEFKLQNVDVDIKLAEGLPTLSADQDQLHQVVLNLLTNARDAMPEGGRLVLSTRVVEMDGEQFVEFRAKDTGKGISPEHLDKLFEPFFTTKEVGKGTGLGLSVCKGIIETHGGHVWAESEKGRGTTFIVQLPIEPTQETGNCKQ